LITDAFLFKIYTI